MLICLTFIRIDEGITLSNHFSQRPFTSRWSCMCENDDCMSVFNSFFRISDCITLFNNFSKRLVTYNCLTQNVVGRWNLEKIGLLPKFSKIFNKLSFIQKLGKIKISNGYRWKKHIFYLENCNPIMRFIRKNKNIEKWLYIQQKWDL